MNFEINVLEQARIDITDAMLYYKLVSEKISLSFREELVSSISQLQHNPKLYQIRYKSIRIKPLNNFPYGIHYILEGKVVYIQRLLHFKRSIEK